MRKFALLLTAFGLLLCAGASAQDKKEASLYNKTLKKVTLKSTNKFLKKYPASTYAPEIARLRDSLLFFALDPEDAAGVSAFADSYPDSYYSGRAKELILKHNTSLIPHEEALHKAGTCLDAVGWRKDNVEHILALDEGLQLRVLSRDGAPEAAHSIVKYTLQDNPGTPRLVLPMEITNIGGKRFYLHFAYLNEGKAGEQEYVEVLYSPETDILNNAMFYGKGLTPKEGETYRIEGQSPENIEGLTLAPEVAWILQNMAVNPSLVPISKADLLTDNAISWWRKMNPKAETSAKKLTFGALDPESSLVAQYKKHRKEKGKSYNCSMFDYRGWTVIVAASRSTGDYLLVWAEPQCKNKNRDKLLNTIYFESNGTTLDLAYYKGRTTFKIKISMANASVKR